MFRRSNRRVCPLSEALAYVESIHEDAHDIERRVECEARDVPMYDRELEAIMNDLTLPPRRVGHQRKGYSCRS